jgi:hypothetical protein
VTCEKYGTIYRELDAGYELYREGSTFLGWFKDAACTRPFVYTEQIDYDGGEPMKLYAGWAEGGSAALGYTLRYVDESGDEIAGSVEGRAAKNSVLWFEAPAIAGYRVKAEDATKNLTVRADGAVLTFTYESTGTVTLGVESMTCYVGGSSLNSSTLPALRFSVATPAGTSLARLSFTLHTVSGGEETATHLETEPVDDADETSLCLMPGLACDLAEDADVAANDYFELVKVSGGAGSAGTYEVRVRATDAGAWDDWWITAADVETGDTYRVDVACEGATVVARAVSDEAGMAAGTAVATTAVRGAADVDATELGSAYAVADAGALSTNGRQELGLLGNGSDDAQAALLFDDLLDVEGAGDSAAIEAEFRAFAEGTTGEDLGGWSAEYKYLDLVNATDGNAVLATSAPVTVVWPYPDGVTYETAGDYEFRVLHYAGLEREYGEGASVAGSAELEELAVEATPEGLVFRTTSFSPYALMWREAGSGAAVSTGTQPPAASGDAAATTEQAVARSGRAALAATADPAELGLASAVLLGGAGTLAARRVLGRKKR